MNLSDLKTNEEAVIVKVKGFGAFRKRIIEMGFVKGKKVKVIKNAPLKDPIEYEIMDYKVSLRRSEAKMIEVISKEEARNLTPAQFEGTITDEVLEKKALQFITHETIQTIYQILPESRLFIQHLSFGCNP